jgi:phage tail sheath protein FI
MTNYYATPGVYIEEQTGPGVIAGVGTGTAAFVGPAPRGPLNQARRITNYDRFLELYAISHSDGTFWPYLTASTRWFYMAHGVRGFFENGGRQAYIVRIGTARAAAWDVENQRTPREVVFRVQAKEEGTAGNGITVQTQATHATGAAGVSIATGSASVTAVNGLEVTVSDSSQFRAGDTVTEDESSRAVITRIQGNVLTLRSAIAGLAANDTLRIANLLTTQSSFRMQDTTGLWPGSVVRISGDDAANPGNSVADYAVVASVDRSVGFVTLSASPARAHSFNLAAATAPALISQDFRLIITPAAGSAETFDDLSLNPLHANYVFSAVQSSYAQIAAPSSPPTAQNFPDSLVNPVASVSRTVNGRNDDPAALTSTEYAAGLKVLKDIDDVNLICIPDAAAHSEYQTIQGDIRKHCETMKDRFAILDSRPGAPPSGPGSVEEQRKNLQSKGGFAALYYPWLRVRKPLPPDSPRSAIPPTMFIPPSGHMAGIFARTDAERGVHKAPANTDVRGVLGLERVLSDGQHGPLNLKGINALRIFPGSNQVTVWGSRTTVNPNVTDWLYVNVRRLMLYLEESIEEGIRWAVFEPNNLALWQKLKRTISEFLTRVWRDGALFGETADKAFYVRIDEGLNPPSTRALGRLYIEVGLAAVRPAEFIIVRIGLWDGKAEVSES